MRHSTPTGFPRFRRTPKRRVRRGNIVVLTAIFMVAFGAMAAFSIDVGYMLVVRTELQRAADAAALAATLELAGDTTDPYRVSGARRVAAEYASRNQIVGQSPLIDENPTNDPEGDVVIGHVLNWSSRPIVLDTSDPSEYNAVRVHIERTSSLNGEVPTFFGRILGRRSFAAGATATAAIWRQIEGFQTPPANAPLPILPVALNANDWNDMMDGTVDTDELSWDENLQEVVAGGDSQPEIELYSERNGSPGNFGTVRIGRANNATSALSDQILDGMTVEDLDYHGGELRFDENGHLPLPGEPGVSASIRRDFEQILGETRIIPIFDQVNYSGATAEYRITKFVGIRVVDVRLNGSHLQIIIQPADVSVRGGIPSEDEQFSDFIYTSVQLIE